MVQQIKEKRRYVKSPNWRPRPSGERRVMVYGTVKKMYWNEAQNAISELIKQWK